MKTKLFTLLFAILASVVTMNAQQPAEISVTDNSLADWNNLPAAYVAEAVRPSDAFYTGLNNVKVYATESYINILVEPNMEIVTDLEWVPFDIFFDTDNSDLTGGYGDIFEDANTDILLEGGLYSVGTAVSYAPGVYQWWGEIGGYGWEWTDPEIVHTDADCWGALVCEGSLAGCSSQYVDGKFEIQILRSAIPVTWNDTTFGIGMGIMQSWDFVGVLPISSPTNDNLMGAANKLKVRIHKAAATGMESVSSQEKVSTIMRNGQIFIRRGEKTYTVTGQEVK